MSSLLVSTLIKLALPTVTLALVLFVANKRKLDYRNDIGFRFPGTYCLDFLADVVGSVDLGRRITDG